MVLTSLNAFLTLETEYTVESFTSPEEALELLKTKTAEVIISDYLMPKMNGIQLLGQSRELQPEAARILLTGHADKAKPSPGSELIKDTTTQTFRQDVLEDFISSQRARDSTSNDGQADRQPVLFRETLRAERAAGYPDSAAIAAGVIRRLQFPARQQLSCWRRARAGGVPYVRLRPGAPDCATGTPAA
jgi:DNA-binding NarL/FixJ family response regulator